MEQGEAYLADGVLRGRSSLPGLLGETRRAALILSSLVENKQEGLQSEHTARINTEIWNLEYTLKFIVCSL